MTNETQTPHEEVEHHLIQPYDGSYEPNHYEDDEDEEDEEELLNEEEEAIL